MFCICSVHPKERRQKKGPEYHFHRNAPRILGQDESCFFNLQGQNVLLIYPLQTHFFEAPFRSFYVHISHKWTFLVLIQLPRIRHSRAVENAESARSVIYAISSAHSAYFNVSRQKVPYFNVSRQNRVVFKTVLQQNNVEAC